MGRGLKHGGFPLDAVVACVGVGICVASAALTAQARPRLLLAAAVTPCDGELSFSVQIELALRARALVGSGALLTSMSYCEHLSFLVCTGVVFGGPHSLGCQGRNVMVCIRRGDFPALEKQHLP